MKTCRFGMMSVAALTTSLTMACSSGSSTGVAADGGSADVGSTDSAMGADQEAAATQDSGASDVEAGCNNLANTAPSVQEENVSTAPPTPKGGTIPDGKYFLTAAKVYTGPGGASGPTAVTDQLTDVVSAGTFQYVEAVTGGTGSGGVYSGTIATSGTTLTLTFTCGGTGKSAYSTFDSDGTTVTVYGSLTAGQTSALTFTKQ
jgi:hypothetical protein